MICLGLLVLGVLSAKSIPMQLMPPMERPEFTIITELKGAGPQELEDQITWPIERAVATSPGLESMDSASTRERSEIHLRFRGGTPILDTIAGLRDKVDSAGLPSTAGKSKISRAGANQEPLIRLALRRGKADKSDFEFVERLSQTLVRSLERVDGVALATFVGTPHRTLELEIHPSALQVYGLSLSQISQQIQALSRTLSAGEVVENGKRMTLRVGQLNNSLNDLMSLVLKRDEERTVTLRDISRPKLSETAPPTLTRLNGKPCLILEIRREPGANAVDVASRVRALLDEAKSSEENTVDLEILFDEGSQIEAAVNNVKSSVQQGAVLAAFCVYLLIQSAWPTFVVTVIIPLSLFLTLIGMHFSGVSFNLMSLAGLALGVGMLVDSSMVMLESINEESLEIPDRKEAALRGAQKVIGAIVGSTLATIAVFGPLAFISGPIGQVFRDVALTVSFCLTSSLFIAVSVIPMLCSVNLDRFFAGLDPMGLKKRFNERGSSRKSRILFIQLLQVKKEHPLGTLWHRYRLAMLWTIAAMRERCMIAIASRLPEESEGSSAGWNEKINRLWSPLFRAVGGALHRTEEFVRVNLPALLDRPRKPLIWVCGATFLSVILLAHQGSELFPEDEDAGLVYRLDFTPGLALDASEAQVIAIEKAFMDSKDFSRIASVIGSPSSHQAQLLLVPHEKRKYAAKKTMQRIFNSYPELSTARISTSLIASGKPFQLEIYHDNLDSLGRLSNQALNELEKIPGLVDLETDQKAQLREVEISFKKPLLDFFEIDPASFVFGLRSLLQGEEGGTFLVAGNEAQVKLRTPASIFKSVDDIKAFSIPNRDRRAFLADVAQVKEVQSPALIRHIDRKRVGTVSAYLENLDLESAASRALRKLDGLWRHSDKSNDGEPPGAWKMGGADQDRKQNQAALLGAVGLSIFLIFLLLASQFESLVRPLIVLLTVPLCISGVAFALSVTSTPISAQVLVGFVILVGSSVNTSIVMVDFANQLRVEGKTAREAIVNATIKRLRPIIVTTITNILGLLPMIFATGQGAAMQRPLALTLVGGLVSSTLLCLFIVPLAYSKLERTAQ